MVGKVVVEIVVVLDDFLQCFQCCGFMVFIYKGEEGSDKVGGVGGGGVCFVVQVVENGFDWFSVLLSGYKVGQLFVGVGEQYVMYKVDIVGGVFYVGYDGVDYGFFRVGVVWNNISIQMFKCFDC